MAAAFDTGAYVSAEEFENAGAVVGAEETSRKRRRAKKREIIEKVAIVK